MGSERRIILSDPAKNTKEACQWWNSEHIHKSNSAKFVDYR